jgi:radical SAM-linked protein
MSRIRFIFARGSQLAFLSHLDLMRLFQRAMRRSKLPVAYSQGYNPHMRFIIALPLPLGVTAGNEFAEVFFTDSLDPQVFLDNFSAQLPVGLSLPSAWLVEENAPSIAAQIAAARYKVKLSPDRNDKPEQAALKQAIALLLATDEILLSKTSKKKKLSYTNIRPYIYELTAAPETEDQLSLEMLVKAGSEGGVAPSFLLEKLGEKGLKPGGKVLYWLIHRESLYIELNGCLQPLTEGM